MKRTVTNATMTKDERFFWNNAGWSYVPAIETEEQGRLRGAQELAMAERWGEDAGIEVVWEPDDYGYVSRDDDSVEEVLAAQLAYKGKRLPYSLCGIEDPDQNYRRVVGAELMLEAMHDGLVFPEAC